MSYKQSINFNISRYHRKTPWGHNYLLSHKILGEPQPSNPEPVRQGQTIPKSLQANRADPALEDLLPNQTNGGPTFPEELFVSLLWS